MVGEITLTTFFFLNLRFLCILGQELQERSIPKGQAAVRKLALRPNGNLHALLKNQVPETASSQSRDRKGLNRIHERYRLADPSSRQHDIKEEQDRKHSKPNSHWSRIRKKHPRFSHQVPLHRGTKTPHSRRRKQIWDENEESRSEVRQMTENIYSKLVNISDQLISQAQVNASKITAEETSLAPDVNNDPAFSTQLENQWSLIDLISALDPNKTNWHSLLLSKMASEQHHNDFSQADTTSSSTTTTGAPRIISNSREIELLEKLLISMKRKEQAITPSSNQATKVPVTTEPSAINQQTQDSTQEMTVETDVFRKKQVLQESIYQSKASLDSFDRDNANVPNVLIPLNYVKYFAFPKMDTTTQSPLPFGLQLQNGRNTKFIIAPASGSFADLNLIPKPDNNPTTKLPFSPIESRTDRNSSQELVKAEKEAISKVFNSLTSLDDTVKKMSKSWKSDAAPSSDSGKISLSECVILIILLVEFVLFVGLIYFCFKGDSMCNGMFQLIQKYATKKESSSAIKTSDAEVNTAIEIGNAETTPSHVVIDDNQVLKNGSRRPRNWSQISQECQCPSCHALVW